MKKYAIVLAGGEGRRAGGDLPKQFRIVNGKPLVWWSMDAFRREDSATEIIAVVHPGFFDDWGILWNDLPENDRIPCTLVCGGRNRLESVKNGLMEVSGHSLVAIHDAARPALTMAMIRRGWEMAAEAGTAVPVVPVTDSLRKVSETGSVAVVRKDYVAVQTPQVFKSGIIVQAYAGEMKPEFTDDASVAQAAGFRISLYEGEPTNIKVTNPLDFEIASVILGSEETGRK